MINFLKKFITRGVGKAGYIEGVILHDGNRTKRTARLWHIQHRHSENDGLKLDLLIFNKPPGAEWSEDQESEKEISLKEEEVKKLYEYLSTNYAAIGIRQSGNFAIIPLDEDFGKIPKKQRDYVGKLIQALLQTKDETAIKEFSEKLGENPALLILLRNLSQQKKISSRLKKTSTISGEQ